MIGHSLTITGDGAVHPLSSISLNAKWIQFLADSTNGADALIGGSEVSSSVGFPLAAGASQFYPPIAEAMNFYDLNSQMYYLANSDVLHILYGQA